MANDFPDRLETLIKKFDVPEYRRHDVKWLTNNLSVRNSKNEHFKEAMSLLKPMASKIMKKNEIDRIFGKE